MHIECTCSRTRASGRGAWSWGPNSIRLASYPMSLSDPFPQRKQEGSELYAKMHSPWEWRYLFLFCYISIKLWKMLSPPNGFYWVSQNSVIGITVRACYNTYSQRFWHSKGRVGLGTFISKECPGDAESAVSGSSLWESLVSTLSCCVQKGLWGFL